MSDRFTVRAVVVFLGIITLVGMAALWHLVATTEVRDAALLAILAGPTGTALGALSTLLARTGADNHPQPVQVMNQAGDAVPVTDEGGYVSAAWVTAVASVLMLALLVAWAWDLGPFAP